MVVVVHVCARHGREGSVAVGRRQPRRAGDGQVLRDVVRATGPSRGAVAPSCLGPFGLSADGGTLCRPTRGVLRRSDGQEGFRRV